MGDSFLFFVSQITFHISCLEALLEHYKELKERADFSSDSIDSIINHIILEIDFLDSILDLYL